MMNAIPLLTFIALAQQITVTRVALNAGSATDVTGVTSSAASIAPSIWITPSTNFAIGFSGAGTTYRGGAWSAGAGAAVLARRPLGPLALVTEGRSAVTTTSYHHTYLTGELSPALELRVGAVTLFGGGRLSQSLVWEPGRILDGLPGFPGDFGEPERELTRRAGRAALYGAQLNFRAAREVAFTPAYREERGRLASIDQTDRTASLGISRRLVALSASVMTRSAAGERFSGMSASASVALSPAIAVEIAGGKYPANQMTNAAPGSFINAGASFRLNASGKRMPQPLGVAAPRAGETRLAIVARDANTVEVAGDFTNWSMRVARRASNGVWFVDLTIPPGQYRYAFRIDGTEWRVPAGERIAADDFGGKTAWLTVRDSAAGEQAERKEER